MVTSGESSTAAAEMLYDLLVDNEDLAGFLGDLATISTTQVGPGGATHCGVLLERHRRNVVVGWSSPEARKLDETQAGFDAGPCLDAQRTSTLIRVPDVRYEARWPAYMAVVRESGIRSILAVPLTLSGAGAAAMNFYTSDPVGFDDADIERARQHAALASRALSVAVRIAKESEEAADRRRAMESRTAIDVAIGVIMAQNRCRQEEAFDILQKASNNRNLKLRTLAEELVGSIGQQAPITSFDS
ncbi:GAF and ANTAR domain-containing protein [Nesterenkonia xinjiangensis]|uniref:GAF domain-containing protein n=1 Tax=Nesterenkonia xinjiangensis TaxID=225327 RepID=A0A7Z0GJD8_9MICC|nr:GAF and ANTAR domain-containing protein [Nesterenkonia xinjiangensis]NYJ77070.1 GAF domain-containing protein [Nesterenkonia xinjiangensis]